MRLKVCMDGLPSCLRQPRQRNKYACHDFQYHLHIIDMEPIKEFLAHIICITFKITRPQKAFRKLVTILIYYKLNGKVTTE